MAFKDVVSKQDQLFDGRESERIELMIETDGLVGSGERVKVILHNISTSGVLIETGQALQLTQNIHVDVPEAGQVAATIIWSSEQLYGCRFIKPISRAALSAAKLRNPLPSELDPAVEAAQSGQLSQRLRRLREQKGFSLAALSRRSGISKPSIWAWETGKTMPRPRSIHSLAAALGVSASEIWGHDAAAHGHRGSGPDRNAVANPVYSDGSGEQGAIADAVHAARQSIAGAAGVLPARVKITIEF